MKKKKRKKKKKMMMMMKMKKKWLTFPAMRRRMVRVTEGASWGKPLLSTEAMPSVCLCV